MIKDLEQRHEYTLRWEQASHAMQSGVAMEIQMAKDKNEPEPSTTPKHLRVGINNALCDHAALVGLLVEKGIFTDEEYLKAIAVEMEAEKKRYEDRLSVELGAKITLK